MYILFYVYKLPVVDRVAVAIATQQFIPTLGLYYLGPAKLNRLASIRVGLAGRSLNIRSLLLLEYGISSATLHSPILS